MTSESISLSTSYHHYTPIRLYCSSQGSIGGMTETRTQNPHPTQPLTSLVTRKGFGSHMYEIEHTNNQPDFYFVIENIMNIAKIRNTSHQDTRVCSLQIINVLFQSKATIILYHTIQYHLTADQYCKSDQALTSLFSSTRPLTVQ